MRNSVAKKLRKEAGAQTSTSNKLEYKFLKKEHMHTEVNPKLKRSARQARIGKIWTSTSTISEVPKHKRKIARKLKA